MGGWVGGWGGRVCSGLRSQNRFGFAVRFDSVTRSLVISALAPDRGVRVSRCELRTAKCRVRTGERRVARPFRHAPQRVVCVVVVVVVVECYELRKEAARVRCRWLAAAAVATLLDRMRQFWRSPATAKAGDGRKPTAAVTGGRRKYFGGRAASLRGRSATGRSRMADAGDGDASGRPRRRQQRQTAAQKLARLLAELEAPVVVATAATATHEAASPVSPACRCSRIRTTAPGVAAIATATATAMITTTATTETTPETVRRRELNKSRRVNVKNVRLIRIRNFY